MWHYLKIFYRPRQSILEVSRFAATPTLDRNWLFFIPLFREATCEVPLFSVQMYGTRPVMN